MDSEYDFDYVSACIDEIALEGLDGISIRALWKRLASRPKFPITVDHNSKNFFWECIALHEDIEMYELTEPRPPLILYNRYKNMDMDFGIVVEPEEEIVDPYPYAPVEDIKVRGSCSTFTTRVNVTSLIRENGIMLMEFDDAVVKWSEKLVFVASQQRRNIALLGTEISPNIALTTAHYCLLERIGRSRYHGEVTQGKYSLSETNISAKTLFYYRKKLLQKKLIVKQPHFQKCKENAVVSGSLLQLTRFYVERKSKMEVMIMNMCKILEDKPNKQETFIKLRNELGMKEGSFKKMFSKILKNCVKLKIIPYTEMYPDHPQNLSHSLNGKEKVLKVVQLLQPYKEQVEEEEPDDEDDKQGAEDNQVMFHPSKLYFDIPILDQAYQVIDNAGPEGIVSVDIGRIMGLPKLEIRSMVKGLEKLGSIMVVMQDVGRQRTMKYISKRFEGESEAHQQFVEMQQKFVKLTEDQGMFDMDQFQEMEVIDMSFGVTECIVRSDELPDVSVKMMSHSEPAKPSKSWSFSLKDINTAFSRKAGLAPSFTYRMLKRANRIIELVREHKVLDHSHKLQKMLLDEEVQEGISEKIDRCSTGRILHRLAKDGYIKSLKTVLQSSEQIKKLHFICDPSVTPDDPLVQRAIDEAKLRYFSSTQQKKDSSPVKTLAESISSQLAVCMPPQKLEYLPRFGRHYGFEPKFGRMKWLHTLLVYLLYDYQGSPQPKKDGDPIDFTVYKDIEDWRRFVPPLPNQEKTNGWVYLSDIILCMPVSILLKVVNITYRIPGLQDVLDNESKRHLLVQHLSLEIKNLLLFNRKYVYSLHEVLTKLSFIGLVSFGHQKQKEKEKAYFYVHRKTSIKDTSSSVPGYLFVSEKQYPATSYNVTNLTEVHNYWSDLETVCLHTPLGSYNSAVGQSITIVDVMHKPQLLEAIRPKNLAEIDDNGNVPGDSRGAAGHDSSMFSHLKRNWNWPSVPKISKELNRYKPSSTAPTTGEKYQSYLNQNDEKAKKTTVTKTGRKRLQRLPKIKPAQKENVEPQPPLKNPVLPTKTTGTKRKLSEATESRAKKSKGTFIRVITRRNLRKRRKPYYDEKDKEAIDRMTKQRVDWSVQEDSFLLLCKVASCYLDNQYKGIVVNYGIIRDLIHARFPNVSMNKTSRACQRRLNYMLKNPMTVTNVSVYLGESKQDPELAVQFQGPKPPKTNEKAWKGMFTEVLNHLIEKYTLSTSCSAPSSVTLPSTLSEFKRLFDISVSGQLKERQSIHVDPKNDFDIHCSVVFSLVLQGLCSLGDKTNWAFTLYKMYQQYPDTLLRTVIARLKHEGIISKRKDVSKRAEMAVPLSTFPHQLSYKFDNLLLSRYQDSIYPQVTNTHRKLIEAHLQGKGQSFDSNMLPGESAALVALMITNNINFDIAVPDQIIVFDQETEKVSTNLEENASTSSGPKNASRVALYMMRQQLNEPTETVHGSHDNFVINSCDLIARFVPLEKNLKPQRKKMTPKDFLPLEVKDLKDLISSLRQFCGKDFPEIRLEDVNLTFCLQGYSEMVAAVGFSIYSYIFDAKNIGCTFAELYLKYNEKCTQEASVSVQLHLLIESEFILKVGVSCYRYVALCHSRPWLLSTIKIPKEKKSLATQMAFVESGNRVEMDTSQTSEALEALKAGMESPKAPMNRKRSGSMDKYKNSQDQNQQLQDENSGQLKEWLSEHVLQPVETLRREADIRDEVSVCMDQTLIRKIVEDEAVRSDVEACLNSSMKEVIVNEEIETSVQECLEKNISKIQKVEERREVMKCLTEGIEEMIETSIRGDVQECLEEKIVKEVIQNESISEDVDAHLTQEIIPEVVKSDELRQDVQSCVDDMHGTIKEAFIRSDVRAHLQEEILPQIVENVNLERETSNAAPLTNAVAQATVGHVEASSSVETRSSASSKELDLKRRLEERVVREVQALHEKVKANFDNSSAVSVICQWLQTSILKKLEDRCSVEDIKLWFQKTILEKVGNPDAIGVLKQWFEDSIISEFEPKEPVPMQAESSNPPEDKVAIAVKPSEDPEINISKESFHSWFEDQILGKVEDSLLKEEINKWFQTNVLKVLDERFVVLNTKEWFESAVLEKLDTMTELNFKEWFDETFVSKIEKAAASYSLKKWFQEVVMFKVESLRSFEDIKLWFQENVLGQIEASPSPDELKERLGGAVVKYIDERLSDNDIQVWYESFIKKVVDETTSEEIGIWLKEKIYEKVDQAKNDPPPSTAQKTEMMNSSDLKKWFNESILLKIDNNEIATNLGEWFETTVLRLIEKSPADPQGAKFGILDLKSWLQSEIISKLDYYNDIKELLQNTIVPQALIECDVQELCNSMTKNVQASETVTAPVSAGFSVRQWFEDNLLNKLKEIEDQEDVAVLKSDIRVWLEDIIATLQAKEDIEIESKLSAQKCLNEVLVTLDSSQVEETVCISEIRKLFENYIRTALGDANTDGTTATEVVTEDQPGFEITMQLPEGNVLEAAISDSEILSSIVSAPENFEITTLPFVEKHSENEIQMIDTTCLPNVSSFEETSSMEVEAPTMEIETSAMEVETSTVEVGNTTVEADQNFQETGLTTTVIEAPAMADVPSGTPEMDVVLPTYSVILQELIKPENPLTTESSKIIEPLSTELPIIADLPKTEVKTAIDDDQQQTPEVSFTDESETPPAKISKTASKAPSSRASATPSGTKPALRRRRSTRKATEPDTSTSFSQTWEEIRYLSRIWKKPDGTINRPMLQRFLSAVLGHILTFPGISEAKLIEKLELCFSPVHTLDLVEILIKIKCIEPLYLRTSGPMNVLCQAITYQVTEDNVPGATTYYEANVDAMINLAQFIDELVLHRD